MGNEALIGRIRRSRSETHVRKSFAKNPRLLDCRRRFSKLSYVARSECRRSSERLFHSLAISDATGGFIETSPFDVMLT